MNKKKIIGIYRITSPSKKVYIGQSIDINNRFRVYSRKGCVSQTILYRSFLKYGIVNHKFEILCECDEKELNNKERYYQDLYSSVGKNGMNSRLTASSDRSGSLSEETKDKMRSAQSKRSKETCLKISHSKKGTTYSPEILAKYKVCHFGQDNSHARVPVVQLGLDGGFVKEHISVSEAIVEVSGSKSNIGNIVACLKNRRRTAYGYKWIYKSLHLPPATAK